MGNGVRSRAGASSCERHPEIFGPVLRALRALRGEPDFLYHEGREEHEAMETGDDGAIAILGFQPSIWLSAGGISN